MATVSAVAVHCHVTICALVVLVCCCGLSVVRSRRRSLMMHGRCRMIHSGLRHVTVCIEAIVLVVVSALVCNEYLWTVIIAAIPPDAKHVGMSVQTHQVVIKVRKGVGKMLFFQISCCFRILLLILRSIKRISTHY